MDGILVINKPQGMSSHDVIDYARKKLRFRKIGHAGTLDPLATGVLILLIGKSTKLFDKFMSYDKEYIATMALGVKTDSGDANGKAVEKKDYRHVNEQLIEEVFASYRGEIMQMPHMFSAVWFNGKRLYKIAAKGKQIQRTPRKILIKELTLLKFDPPDIQFLVKCSKGTYVRQLAEDIGHALGSVAHISVLFRKSIGPFDIKQSISLQEVSLSEIKLFDI